MKRIRAKIDKESPARIAGLEMEKAKREGFDCLGCGANQHMSKFMMAHWGEVVEHTCQMCGAKHKMKAGNITLKSGPTKRIKRVKEHEEREPQADPRQSLWRAYVILNNTGRPTTYRAVTKYHTSLDACNDEAYSYATNTHAYSKARGEELYRHLLRREEFPLLSQVETNGLTVGAGEISSTGSKLVGKETIHFFTLRDPKGNECTIALRPEDFAALIEEWELKPMTAAEALALAKEKGGG